MKSFTLFFVLELCCCASYAQGDTWTWIKGDSAANSKGNYGTIRVSSPTNEPPGRYACAYWTDTAGNFWIYGGLSFDSVTNLTVTKGDLWKFDPLTTNWTWINGANFNNPSPLITGSKGAFNAQNQPGSISWGPFTWVTPNNHFWIYGGGTTGSTQTSDLWQFDPVLNQWAWMGNFGPANYGYQGFGDTNTMPGFRWEGNSAWVDSAGNLWFFGGWDHQFYAYNDMWMYNVATGMWTWMSGSQQRQDAGAYSPVDTPSLNNRPPARATDFFWKDEEGNFWVEGGYNSHSSVYYTDVWKFNPVTLQWTWVDGDNKANSDNPAGASCEIDPDNEEGSRWENRALWKVCDELIINYGGWNDDNAGGYNDLWGYLPHQKLWVNLWQRSSAGSYGIKGVPDGRNSPYPKYGAVGFKDRQNNLWLFGGSGNGFMNDLWEYVIDTTCMGKFYCNTNCAIFLSNITTDKDAICPNDSALVCAPQGFVSYEWNENDTGKCIQARRAGEYFVTVTDNKGCQAVSNHVVVSAYPVFSVSLTQNDDTLTAYNAVSYQWLKNGFPVSGATSNEFVTTGAGSYTVAVMDSNGCPATSDAVVIAGITNETEINIQLFPNPTTNSWQLTVDETLIGNKLQVYDAEGRLVFQSAIRNQKSEISFNGSPGIYLLQIASPQVSIIKKLVKL